MTKILKLCLSLTLFPLLAYAAAKADTKDEATFGIGKRIMPLLMQDAIIGGAGHLTEIGGILASAPGRKRAGPVLTKPLSEAAQEAAIRAKNHFPMPAPAVEGVGSGDSRLVSFGTTERAGAASGACDAPALGPVPLASDSIAVTASGAGITPDGVGAAGGAGVCASAMPAPVAVPTTVDVEVSAAPVSASPAPATAGSSEAGLGGAGELK